MDKPLFSLLKSYAEDDVIRMHMPGHKGNALPFFADNAKYDITEIPGFDNLHNPEGVLLSSMKLAAKLWGSDNAYYLVNGSTCGILAGIRATVKRGQKVLVARNCHKSVFNALEICGAQVKFIMPPFIGKWGIFGSIRPADIEKALKNDKNISLIILTSPTYEGVISDIRSICKIAHSYGCPVLVDEAHGAHLSFMGEVNNAVSAGADIVVQSLHKTLSCPTQTAICHVSEKLKEKASHQLSVFETSSPSYILLCAIDEFIRHISKDMSIFNLWKKALAEFYDEMQNLEKLEIIGVFADDNTDFYAYDKSKIAVSVKKADITAADLFNVLREKYRIEPEMMGENHGLLMTGTGDGEKSLSRLSAALVEIDRACECKQRREAESFSFENNSFLSLCDAVEADNDLVELQNAEGRICAEYVWAYPPGVPVIVPGEVITKEFCESVNNSKLRLISDSGRIPLEILVVTDK